MTTKKTGKQGLFRLDKYVAERDKDPARQIHRLETIDQPDRLTRARTKRYGERYLAFVHAVEQGEISDKETNAIRLFKRCYAGCYQRRAEALDGILNAFVMLFIGFTVDQLEPEVRELALRSEAGAWAVFDAHFYLVEGDEGIYLFRR